MVRSARRSTEPRARRVRRQRRPDDVSVSGLVIDGVVYAKDCHTRSDPYPYCRHMRHGVFSVTKSLSRAVALLRLAAKYGDGVFEEKISDHVRVTATHDGWKNVTFADALSMAACRSATLGRAATGRIPQPDENQPKMLAWLIKARTAQEKLDHGFNYGRYPWERGEVVRYNTIGDLHARSRHGRLHSSARKDRTHTFGTWSPTRSTGRSASSTRPMMHTARARRQSRRSDPRLWSDSDDRRRRQAA